MKLVEKLKSYSSKCLPAGKAGIKTKGKSYQKFYWQNGYGGFSIHPGQIEIVKNYISIQEEHHKKLSFQEEYQGLLDEYDIDYDERYIWD